MGYTSKVYAGERIELSHGYWCRVRPLDRDKSRSISEQQGDASSFFLAFSIAEWNVDEDVTDADGTVHAIPLPITPETVSILSIRDQARIVAKAKELNNPLADETARGN